MCLSNAGFIWISCGDTWRGLGCLRQAQWGSSSLGQLKGTFVIRMHLFSCSSLWRHSLPCLGSSCDIKMYKVLPKEVLGKTVFSASPDKQQILSTMVGSGCESLMSSEGCALPARGRPQPAKLNQDRVTFVAEGHSGEFPDGFLKSGYYTPLLVCVRALQELPEFGQDRFSSAPDFCGSLVSVQIIWFMPAESSSLEAGPGFKC